jgi:hypothetical protein
MCQQALKHRSTIARYAVAVVFVVGSLVTAAFAQSPPGSDVPRLKPPGANPHGMAPGQKKSGP